MFTVSIYRYTIGKKNLYGILAKVERSGYATTLADGIPSIKKARRALKEAVKIFYDRYTFTMEEFLNPPTAAQADFGPIIHKTWPPARKEE